MTASCKDGERDTATSRPGHIPLLTCLTLNSGLETGLVCERNISNSNYMMVSIDNLKRKKKRKEKKNKNKRVKRTVRSR